MTPDSLRAVPTPTLSSLLSPHAGCSPDLNDDDNVVVVRCQSPLSIVVVEILDIVGTGLGPSMPLAWPVGHCL